MDTNTVRVDDHWLRRWCGQSQAPISPARAHQIVCSLKGLARWWLIGDVLEQAARFGDRFPALRSDAEKLRSLPPLPQDCGACWIALVNNCPGEFPLLRPAYALPLRWRKGPDHDPRLPRSLRMKADEVLAALREEGQIQGSWSLHPASDRLLAGLDLSELESDWGSAWAPLSAGLRLAAWEGKPDPTTWASGDWSAGGGIQRVEGLEAKAKLAYQWGAKVFFVPEGQVEELADYVKSRNIPLDIRPLTAGRPSLARSFSDYWKKLQVPPGREASRRERESYFLHVLDDAGARRYYAECILPDVVEDHRRALGKHLAALEGASLTTIVSRGFDLARLAARVVRPTQCLLLHNDELKNEAEEQRTTIEADLGGCEVRLEPFAGESYEEMLAEFRRAIRTFVDGKAAGRLVFDITPGQKRMTLALYDAIPPGSHVLVFQSKQDPNSRRPYPFPDAPPCYWRTGTPGGVAGDA